jgi:undecaprenyl-diphosphatase
VVASTFILGGFIILWAEKRPQAASAHPERRQMTPGCAQGRAGAVPGHDSGHQPQRRHHHRRHAAGPVAPAATDFSFYLAIPTLIGAGAYSLYKERALLSMADLPLFGVGLLFSFVSAWICVRWLLRYIATHTFVPFAWYRIAFGSWCWERPGAAW